MNDLEYIRSKRVAMSSRTVDRYLTQLEAAITNGTPKQVSAIAKKLERAIINQSTAFDRWERS